MDGTADAENEIVDDAASDMFIEPMNVSAAEPTPNLVLVPVALPTNAIDEEADSDDEPRAVEDAANVIEDEATSVVFPLIVAVGENETDNDAMISPLPERTTAVYENAPSACPTSDRVAT